MWTRWIRGLMIGLMIGAPLVPMAANEQTSALYKAARMRYLSQRIAKAYLQAALDVRPEKAVQIIDASVKQSQALLTDLKGTSASNPEITKALADFEAKGKALYDATSGKPVAGKTAEIIKLSDEVFSSGDRLATGYQTLEKTPLGKLQNLAGRERGLSQRMARDFFVVKLGQGAPAAGASRAARQQFTEGLETMTTAPVSTPAIQNNLALLRLQWQFFEQAIDNAGSPASSDNIATTSERILEVLDELVNQYEAVMRSLR